MPPSELRPRSGVSARASVVPPVWLRPVAARPPSAAHCSDSPTCAAGPRLHHAAPLTPLSVLLSPHGSARGLAITYPPLAYISLVAPTPPPSPSGRSGCARVLPGLAAAVGGHLSFETGPLLQDTLLAYGLRSVRLSCGPGRPRMALWRACIACPLRALNSLGPVAGRVPLPSGSFRLHVLCCSTTYSLIGARRSPTPVTSLHA